MSSNCISCTAIASLPQNSVLLNCCLMIMSRRDRSTEFIRAALMVKDKNHTEGWYTYTHTLRWLSPLCTHAVRSVFSHTHICCDTSIFVSHRNTSSLFALIPLWYCTAQSGDKWHAAKHHWNINQPARDKSPQTGRSVHADSINTNKLHTIIILHRPHARNVFLVQC